MDQQSSIGHFFQMGSRTELRLHSYWRVCIHIQSIGIYFEWLLYKQYFWDWLTIPIFFATVTKNKRLHNKRWTRSQAPMGGTAATIRSPTSEPDSSLSSAVCGGQTDPCRPASKVEVEVKVRQQATVLQTGSLREQIEIYLYFKIIMR